MDHVMNVIVLIWFEYFELFCVKNLHILYSLQIVYLFTDFIPDSH